MTACALPCAAILLPRARHQRLQPLAPGRRRRGRHGHGSGLSSHRVPPQRSRMRPHGNNRHDADLAPGQVAHSAGGAAAIAASPPTCCSLDGKSSLWRLLKVDNDAPGLEASGTTCSSPTSSARRHQRQVGTGWTSARHTQQAMAWHSTITRQTAARQLLWSLPGTMVPCPSLRGNGSNKRSWKRLSKDK
jgi:hypothetical protein